MSLVKKKTKRSTDIVRHKIYQLAKEALNNRQDAINNGIDHLNSYYHGKMIAYEEILNYITRGTTKLNRKV